jgi:hypothetical protein
MGDAKGSRNVASWAFHSLLIRMRFMSKPRYRSYTTHSRAVYVKTALPDVWPILGTGTKACPDGIHSDVMGLLDRGFHASQAMIEEIPLPMDGMGSGKPSLPSRDALSHEK